MTKSTGVGRGGARANAGRKTEDGVDIVACVSVSVHQIALDLIQELGQGNDSLGVRAMANELAMYRALQSTAKPSSTRSRAAQVGTPLPILPKLKVIPEFNEDGNRYNMHARIKLEKEAKDRYDLEMLEYRRQTGTR